MKNYSHKKENQIAVDVSPSYLFHYKSAALIKEAFPNVKIVFGQPEEKDFNIYTSLVKGVSSNFRGGFGSGELS